MSVASVVVALGLEVVLHLARRGVHGRAATVPRDERLVELRAEDRLDLRPVGGARPRLRPGLHLRQRGGQQPVRLDRLRVGERGDLHGQVARPGQRHLGLVRAVPLHEGDRVVLVRRRRRDAVDEDADLGERADLLGDDAEVELADLLGRRRVVGLDGVARVLDDRRRVAAEDRRALLVGVELRDAGRGDRLQRAYEEVRRRLALRRVEGGVPLVVEHGRAERQEDRVERRDDRVALHPAEHEAVLDLVRRDARLGGGHEVVPRGGRRGEDVVAVGEGLQVPDRRQGDQLGLVVLEALDARALLRGPVAELRERRRVVAVGGDAVGAEILEDPRGRVLRDPRVVHDVDVVLPRLRLAVLERLGEEGVVRLREELDLDPGGLLEHRQDRLLERRERAVLEGADDEVAATCGRARAARARCGTASRPAGSAAARGEEWHAGGGRCGGEAQPQDVPTADVLDACHVRIPSTSWPMGLSSLDRWTAVVPSGVKKQARAGSMRTPTGEPAAAVQPRGARTDTRVSPSRTSTNTSSPSGSTTYTLPTMAPGVPAGTSSRSRARTPTCEIPAAAQARYRSPSGTGLPATAPTTTMPARCGSSATSRTFIGGLPTNSATNRFAGRSNTSWGGAYCWTRPSRSRQTRSAIVRASTWSCVT